MSKSMEQGARGQRARDVANAADADLRNLSLNPEGTEQVQGLVSGLNDGLPRELPEVSTTNKAFGGERFNPQAGETYRDLLRRSETLGEITDKEKFLSELSDLVHTATQTDEGITFLQYLVPSIEMNAPGNLSRLADSLRIPYEGPLDAETVHLREVVRANYARGLLELQASQDEARPTAHPRPSAGWGNDPHGIDFLPDGSIRIHYQGNDYSFSWQNMAWARYTIGADGSVDQKPTMLTPRGLEHGIEVNPDHYFSGSTASLPDPNNPGQEVTAAFISAVGSERTFLKPADTLVRIAQDADLNHWSEPVRVTTEETFPRINGKSFIDGRDPYVTVIDGEPAMLIAGRLSETEQGSSADRDGHTVVAYLRPGSDDFIQPWEFVSYMHEDPRTVSEGGPGIAECPALVRFQDEQGSDVDLFLHSAQNNPDQGPIGGRPATESIEGYTGHFNPKTGEFQKEKNFVMDHSAENAAFAATAVLDPVTEKPMVAYWLRVPGDGQSWQGIHTLRTFEMRDGEPWLSPHRSLESLRDTPLAENETETLNNGQLHFGEAGRELDFSTKLKLNSEGAEAGVSVLSTRDGSEGVQVRFDGRNVSVGANEREIIPISDEFTDSVDLRVVVDRKVVEVYANGKVLTKVVPEPPVEPDGSYAECFSLFSRSGGAAFESISLYRLRSAYQ